MNTRTWPLIAAFLMAALTFGQQSQSIVYEWLNVPCTEMLNCDQGCSACNLSSGGNGVLIGTNMAWIGVSTCPVPVASGDNAVLTYGWPTIADDQHYVIFSGIAAVPMRIDSLIINHTSATNGPARLKVAFTNDVAAPMVEISDALVPPSFDDVIFTNLGEIAVPPGSPYGSFQVKLTPYQGWGEPWSLNEVRVVCSPVEQSGVGMPELWNNRSLVTVGPWFDVMGRRTGEEPAPGVYVGPVKRVRVF